MSEVTTALTLVAPDQFHDDINEIRKQCDRAYPRWMPHINFLFPFVSTDQFDDIKSRLEPYLKNVGSFDLDMSEIGHFKQGKNVTVHLKPKDSTKLRQVFDIIRQVLPEIPSKHEEFAPHLTIAQFKNSELQTKLPELQTWLASKNFKFTIDHVCLLERSKTDNNVPFSVHSQIKLC